MPCRSQHVLGLTLVSLGWMWHAPIAYAQAHLARRVAVSWSVGGHIGGPASALEGAMRASGFGDDEQCWLFCTGTVSHPFSRTTGGTSTLALSYLAAPWLEIRLQRTTADLGTTFGYHAATDALLAVRQSVATVAALAMVSPDGLWWVGAGPSLNVVADDRTDAGGAGQRASRLGAVLDLGFTAPAHSLLFLSITGQYHYVGSSSVGPFSSTGLSQNAGTTIPQFNASFSHGLITVGLGIRL